MKKYLFLLLILSLSITSYAHCGGCGPTSSDSKHTKIEKSLSKEKSCGSCETKITKKTSLNLNKKKQIVCDEILQQYYSELQTLQSKYISKFDQVLTASELNTYLDQHNFNSY